MDMIKMMSLVMCNVLYIGNDFLLLNVISVIVRLGIVKGIVKVIIYGFIRFFIWLF